MIELAARGPYPAIDEWLARRVLAGMHPKALVVASGGAFSLRTAYRYRASLLGIERVEVGGFAATFVLYRDRPPSRLGPWELVPSTVREARRIGARCGRWMPIAQEPCHRLAHHSFTCKSREAMENGAAAERRKRATRRRERQRLEQHRMIQQEVGHAA